MLLLNGDQFSSSLRAEYFTLWKFKKAVKVVESTFEANDSPNADAKLPVAALGSEWHSKLCDCSASRHHKGDAAEPDF